MRAQVAVAAFTMLTACSGSPRASSSWTTTRDTLPSGIVRVTNTPPASGSESPAVIVKDLRIGTREGSGPDAFGQIKGLAVLGDGRIAVLDGQAEQVRMFDPSGAYLRSFAGEGQGPGELERGGGLMRDGRDRLWVPDYPDARMSVFDPDSGYLKSIPMKGTRFGGFWLGAILTDGRIVKTSFGRVRGVLHVLRPDMTQIDSIQLPNRPALPANLEDVPSMFYWRSPDGRHGMGVAVPFYPYRALAFGPAGDVWSSPAVDDRAYRITRRSLDGDTALVLETKRTPVPVTPAERDSAVKSVRAQFAKFGAHINFDWSKIPKIHPAITQMFVSEGGQLWVRSPALDAPVRFDVYGRDGGHLRTVETSLGIALEPTPIVRGDTVWAVVKDALGVQYVVRGEIREVSRSEK